MYRALFTTYSTLFTIHIQGSFRNVKGSFHQFYSGPWRYLTQAQYRVLSQNIWLFSQYVGLFSSMLFRALTLSKFRRNTGLFSQNMGHVHKIKGSFTQCRALFTIYFITLCAGSVFMWRQAKYSALFTKNRALFTKDMFNRIMCVYVTYINAPCLTREWVMSHTWMSYVTYMNESCFAWQWVTSHTWMSHVTHMNESRLTYEWVMSHMRMNHVTHMNESCHTYQLVMSQQVWGGYD